MAFCVNCGIKLDEGTKYCANCGTEIDEITNGGQNPYAPPQHESAPISGKRNLEYDIIQPNSVLRACAKEQLQGAWGQMAFAYFILFLVRSPYYIVNIIYQSNKSFVISSFYIMLALAVSITGGAFSLGFSGYFLKRIRGEEILLGNIFDGFKRFGTAFAISFLSALQIILWSLLLIIPGIIKAFGYSMAYYIAHDNPGIYSSEALEKSQIMMKGHKFKLFLLELSFIGWILLGSLPLGIGLLWVYPYMNLSMANFYENLKTNQEETQSFSFNKE